MSVRSFRHQALFYAGIDEFLAGIGAFIRDGVRRREPVLAVLNRRKIGLLRRELGSDADAVQFADMEEVGRNPARIIPACRRFVTEHAGGGGGLRGIGEPIWAGRSADELVECERHESLLNLAFHGPPAWWLLCPYDTETLSPSVLREARRNHPFLQEDGSQTDSTEYEGVATMARPFDLPLPEPPGSLETMAFARGDLPHLRAFVGRHGPAWGLDPERTEDLVLAVNEVATNSIRYGGGGGVLRIWRQEADVICEVSDHGRISDPLVGREFPSVVRERGFGLWLVNHLCDLVQVRSFPTGSVVRLHVGVEGGLPPPGVGSAADEAVSRTMNHADHSGRPLGVEL
jgi:anti-sigma regulatory factor (Ser/Thr protein kinase)